MDISLRLYISCIPYLSGIQQLAVLLTGISLADLRRMGSLQLSRFLQSHAIIGNAQTICLDPVKTERDADEIGQWLHRPRRKICFLGDDDYPLWLSNSEAAPFRLLAHGTFPRQDSALVAVAGTRTPSKDALQASYQFGLECGLNGISCISAVSAGCDQACHRGQADAKVRSYGLLGCGHDIGYPCCNSLRERMIELHGGLVSPFAPWQQPIRWRMLFRNEVLASYAPMLVLMQGGSKSGTLSCASRALGQGRDVYVHQAGAQEGSSCGGTRMLVESGAPVVQGVADLLAHDTRPLVLARALHGRFRTNDVVRTALASGSLYRYKDAWYTPLHGQRSAH